jgi:predicted kinase
MPKLILIRGFPGSGKSTFAKQFKCLHLEQDMALMKDGEYKWTQDSISEAVNFCQKMTSKAIELGVDVVVSNTFTRLWEMDFYLRLAKYYKYEVEVYRMMGNYGSIHNVPEKAMEKMRARWQDFPGEIKD